jgi:ParB-like chromosome segregation protein Spo0J
MDNCSTTNTTPKTSLAVTYLPVNSLATHSKKQLRKIAESIREFGFTNPILINTENTIVVGHGRVEAARLLNLKQVPTICLENLTAAQMRAYVLADNRLAEEAGWDPEIPR